MTVSSEDGSTAANTPFRSANPPALDAAIAWSAAFGRTVNVTGVLNDVSWAPVAGSVTDRSKAVPFGLPATLPASVEMSMPGGSDGVMATFALATETKPGGTVRPTFPAMTLAPAATLTVTVTGAGAVPVSEVAPMA